MKALILIPFVAETAAVAYYTRIMHPNISYKTLFTKLTCSLIFIITAVMAVFISGTRTEYAEYMLIGFCCSFLGDFFLHIKPKLGSIYVNIALGGISFIAAHVFYLISYIKTSARLFPGEKAVRPGEIIAVVILTGIVFAVFAAVKLRMGKLIPALIVYAGFLMFMAVEASSLGFGIMKAGIPGGAGAFATLALGGLLFACSDTVLAISFFGKEHEYRYKCLNIVFYYVGQMLLACSLLFVK